MIPSCTVRVIFSSVHEFKSCANLLPRHPQQTHPEIMFYQLSGHPLPSQVKLTIITQAHFQLNESHSYEHFQEVFFNGYKYGSWKIRLVDEDWNTKLNITCIGDAISKMMNLTSAEWNRALSSLNKGPLLKSLIFIETMKKYLCVCVCVQIF